MLSRLRRFTLCSLALVPFAGPALAGDTSAWSAREGTAARLVAGGAQEGSHDGSLIGGVEIRLPEGLKTYWRYPGDSGVPPHFDWSGSRNVEAVEVLWPAPVRFDDGGSFSIGYKRDVVLPLRITPKDRSQPVDLKLNLDFAVCGKICQPANAALDLALPPGGIGAPSAALTQALASVPRPAELGARSEPGIAAAELHHASDGATIRIATHVGNAATADLFVEGPDEDWALPLPARETGADGRTIFVLPVDGIPKGADVTTARLRFTLVDGDRAIEVDTPLSAR
ncbi:DsbC/DsbD-like thiol-disulfide interchange protein [Ancylobacter aquaticus]|uniref:DsbC/DsbD-like thiol-disulfide interchange protein n=2 Tax=Ancylobacter aquaticus TaxID=100 RepID=A0A4R1HLD9_ANCAQ|nr:DsbC/DsbD-like thiol-disulfide interchange protein [Ancylobacter aquaticus]